PSASWRTRWSWCGSATTPSLLRGRGHQRSFRAPKDRRQRREARAADTRWSSGETGGLPFGLVCLQLDDLVAERPAGSLVGDLLANPLAEQRGAERRGRRHRPNPRRPLLRVQRHAVDLVLRFHFPQTPKDTQGSL